MGKSYKDMSREELLEELAAAREEVRRLGEERLSCGLNNMAVLADGLGLGFFAKEPGSGGITVFNREMGRILGREPGDVMGLGEEEVLGKRAAAMGWTSESASMGSKAPVCVEEHLPGPLGPVFARTVRWAMCGDRGECCALVCLVQDLSGQKHLVEGYRAMARNMIDVYYRVDPTGRLMYVTPSGAKLLGYDDTQEMLGRDVAKEFYVHPERRDYLLGRLSQIDMVENLEVELRARDGRIVPVEVNCRGVRDERGNLVSVEGVIRDISKRKSLEGLYRVSERYYRQLFDNTGTAMAIFGQDAVVKRCNARFEELAGVGRAEIEGRLKLFAFVSSLDQARVQDFHRRRLQTGPHAPPTRYQFKFSSLSGRIRDVLANVAVIPESRERIMSLIDVTELKEMERALFEAAQRLRDAQAISGVGSWEYIYDTGATYWSDETYRHLGYQPGAVVPSPEAFYARVHPDDVAIVRDIERLAGEENKVHTLELRLMLPGGAVNWHKMSVRADRNAAGQRRLLGLGMDITGQKEREEQIIQAMKRAEEANRAKTEFLANVSHEIRTPANVVTSMLKLLSLQDLPEEQMEFVRSANLAVGGLVNLLNDLLDLSRIEAGAMEIKEEPFVFSGLFDQVAASFGSEALERDIVLECRARDGFPQRIVSDESRLRQILFNLVGNAVKHTKRGRVDVEADLSWPEGEGRSHLTLVVRDTGSGIDSDDLAKVFQPFARGKAEDAVMGAGLGLAIVQKLSRLMGGDVAMDSEPGKGTTATVRLEVGVAPDLEEPASASVPVKAASERTLDILVVEDDVVSRRGLMRFLEIFGHRPEAAGDGSEALDKLGSGRYDVVLMDVRMPVMDGMEAVRRIRRGEAGPDKAEVPVIALTAQAMKGDRDRLVEAGMNDYLPKPLDYDMLMEMLARVGG